MIFAFDTNVLIEIDLLNTALIEALKKIRKPLRPALPSPVISEYYYGFLGTTKKENVLKTIEEYAILDTSKDSAILFAELKYRLQKSGQIIPDMDILIASICIDNDVTLLTFDKQFEKIKELDKVILEF